MTVLIWNGNISPRRVFDLISKQDGYNYVLTAEAVTASASSITPKTVSIKGKYYGDTVFAKKTVYDMSTGNVIITLKDAVKYDKTYNVKINGETYTLTTEEVLPAQNNSVSLRNAVISKDKKTATVNVYNTTYGQVTAEVKGVNPDGEEITSEVVIDAESVGSVTFTGTRLDKYTWSVSTK